MDNPRNIWNRLAQSLAEGRDGNAYDARRLVDAVRYAPEMTASLRDVYLEAAGTSFRTEIPEDFTRNRSSVLHPPIRRLFSSASHPKPYPFGLALPDFAGPKNDTRFLFEAALDAPALPQRVHVVTAAGSHDHNRVEQLCAGLSLQHERVPLTVFAPSAGGAPLQGSGYDSSDAPLLSKEGAERLEQIAVETDIVIFIMDAVQLDSTALSRLRHVLSTSRQVIMPLLPIDVSSEGLFSMETVRRFNGRYPFRNVAGLNLAVPAALLRQLGGLETRFEASWLAGRELAFRAYNAGCYMVPLSVSQLSDDSKEETSKKDTKLYKSLCPNHWDRKSDGLFEVPKVSIYIPAYNASKYICSAIDSVLEQDFQDLEVCIADDGSRDGTRDLLERVYATEQRVRWISHLNGGIGYASNRAISMSRGLYVGQLDSDDRLKPGAVRRLAEHLDEKPDVVCVYGSCERVDAAGNYLQDEYSWPEFSREKMMITSIAHHFRMFRRMGWERTTRFREDIANAVDYDLFLKLAEIGSFHHIDEKLYQRRWHGENTSHVNEGKQTVNTHVVQREALERLGLEKFWDVHVPNPKHPRKVSYRRRDDVPMVVTWPVYLSNPYQRLLYAKAGEGVEVVGGDIDAALRLIDKDVEPRLITFHLHWINQLFNKVENERDARSIAEAFLSKIETFRAKGGRMIWTLHNTISHDTPFHDLEVEVSRRLVILSDVLHLHSEASIPEIEEHFALPPEKIRISRHGAYHGAYPNFVSRAQAREVLGISPKDDVIVFTGQVRPYKGVRQLITAFRQILKDRPNALLLIAGHVSFDILSTIEPALTEYEMSRIRFTEKFVDETELQVYFGAADIAAYPYSRILTSGSLLLALTFGVPVVIPEVGMTREVLESSDAGLLYDGTVGATALEAALRKMLGRKDTGQLEHMHRAAADLSQDLDWPDIRETLLFRDNQAVRTRETA